MSGTSLQKFVLSVGLSLLIFAPCVSTAEDQVIVLSPKSIMKGRQGGFHCLSFSPTGKTVAAGGGGHRKPPQLTLLSTSSGRRKAQLKVRSGRVQSVAFSPKGKILASAAGGEVTLWNLAGNKPKAVLKGYEVVGSLAFTPDGKTLVFRCGKWAPIPDKPGFYPKGRIEVWNMTTGRLKFTIDTEARAVAISRDGRILASVGRQFDVDEKGKKIRQGTISLWTLDTGKHIRTMKGNRDFTSVVFLPDGKTLVLGQKSEDFGAKNDPETITLWDVETGQKKASLKTESVIVHSVAVSPDGNLLASGGSSFPGPMGEFIGELIVWDIKTQKTRAKLLGHNSSITGVCFSPDGKILASSSTDDTVMLWNLSSLKLDK